MTGQFITRFFWKNKAQIWPKHKNSVRTIQDVIVVSVWQFCDDNRVCFPYDNDKSSMFKSSCLQAIFVKVFPTRFPCLDKELKPEVY